MTSPCSEHHFIDAANQLLRKQNSVQAPGHPGFYPKINAQLQLPTFWVILSGRERNRGASKPPACLCVQRTQVQPCLAETMLPYKTVPHAPLPACGVPKIKKSRPVPFL